jgi:hypothetical protein
MKNDEGQQEILLAVLGTAKKSSGALDEIIENIKQALESLLTPLYKKNAAQLKAAVDNAMDPMLSDHADENVKPFVESLQRIHQDVEETNREMMKVETTIGLLQGRTTNSQAKAVVERQLRKLNSLNQEYKRTYKLLHKDTMTLGLNKSNLNDPAVVKELNKKLKVLHEQTNELKNKAKQKNVIVQQVEEITRPKPGKS